MSEYVKLQSWHIVSTTYRGGAVKTLCGRDADRDALMAVKLPGEKSCEACLRIFARRPQA